MDTERDDVGQEPNSQRSWASSLVAAQLNLVLKQSPQVLWGSGFGHRPHWQLLVVSQHLEALPMNQERK